MMLDIQNLLFQSSLVLETVPQPAQIQTLLLERISHGHPIRAMYGETYDRFGPTLGSLKYYFYVAAIKTALQENTSQVHPVILVADIATCRNEPPDTHSELMSLGRIRADFVRTVSNLYKLDLEVMLMSDYLHSEEFQARLERVRQEAGKQPQIYEWIKQTVPLSKVGIEADKDFAYAFEEVATIISYDIKVGPPRERYYDEPARLIGESLGLPSLLSVYLRPTYPLGFGRAYFFSNQEIEQYGVTPYKAGSKGLQAHRVIIGKTSPDTIKDLVKASVVSNKGMVPNAVLDLAVISEMARQRLAGIQEPIIINEQLLNGRVSPDAFKERAVLDLEQYVLNPLKAAIG